METPTQPTEDATTQPAKDTASITCGNCQTLNPPGAKFCNGCSRPLAQDARSLQIVCGANGQTLNLGEEEVLTVGQIREKLSDVLNIPESALAIIGEETVDDDRQLALGETVQFIKQAGTKGQR